MADKRVLLGSSTQSPTDNQKRHVVILPGQPSKDFVVTARCRIMNVGEKIKISASDLPGDSGGTYSWRTDSDKIRVSPATGATVTVEALATPSASRYAEIITVTRTAKDGTEKTKTVTITVARVTFGPSPAQAFGYDDYDTAQDCNDDHVSVASEKETIVAVKIEGGALGSDFDFMCDHPSICTAGPVSSLSAFDLKLRAKACGKKKTMLRAKVKCLSATTFAQLTVHVYSEVVVKLVIAKIEDKGSRKTALQFPSVDYTKLAKTYNDKLREAVVKVEMRNYDPTNGVTRVAYDIDQDGSLNYDINEGGAKQRALLNMFLSCEDDEILVVIVRSMASNYYLELPAQGGDMKLTVRGTKVYNTKMTLGAGSTKEEIEVKSTKGNVAYLASPLKFNHAIGEALGFSAIGWSGNPVLVGENGGNLDQIEKTIVHEALHTALGFADIEDATNIMHSNSGTTSQRLRHIPRKIRYNSNDTQSQWDCIERPPVMPLRTTSK